MLGSYAANSFEGVYYSIDSGNTKIEQRVGLLCPEDQTEGQTGKSCCGVINAVTPRLLGRHRRKAPNAAWGEMVRKSSGRSILLS